MSDLNPYGVEEVSVLDLDVPNIVIDGVRVIVPQAPLGQVGIVVDAKLITSHVVKVPFLNLAADVQLVNVGGVYLGHSIREHSGTAPATVDFYDGTSTTGILFNPVSLVANESTRDWYPLPGIPIVGGIFAHAVTGTVDGCIYFGVRREHAGFRDGEEGREQ